MDGETMIKALGFDLDNTLYDQSQHTTAFARYSAKRVSEMASVSPEEAEEVMIRKWRELTSYHRSLFNEVLKDLHAEQTGHVAELVKMYHHFKPELTLFPNTEVVLQRLSAKYKMFLITDGNFEMQQWKVRALKIGKYFNFITYTGQHGRKWVKPSPIPYRNAIDCLECRPSECAFVGDNPLADFKGAQLAGMTTIRVLTGPFVGLPLTVQHTPHHNIEKIDKLEELLQEVELG